MCIVLEVDRNCSLVPCDGDQMVNEEEVTWAERQGWLEAGRVGNFPRTQHKDGAEERVAQG